MENVENTEWSDRELIPNRDVESTINQGSRQENQILNDGRTPTWETPTTNRQPTRRTIRRDNPHRLSGRNGYDVGNPAHNGNPRLETTIITPDNIAEAATITPEAADPRGDPTITIRNPESNEEEADIIFDDYKGSLFEDSWYTPPDVNTGPYVMREEGRNEANPRQHYLDQQRGDDVLWHNVECCLQLRSPRWKRFQREELHGDVNQLVHLVLQPNEIASRRRNHLRCNTS